MIWKKYGFVMGYFYLILAGIFEISFAVGMKYTGGFTKLWPSVITIILSCLGLYFLSLALKHIPLGTAYAIWTGMGVIGTTIFGIILFAESTEMLKFIFIALITIGIVGLKLITE